MLLRALVPLAVALPALAASKGEVPTFHQDVLPVLQKNCQDCHRPGEAAPMPLLTYEEARPWAYAMKEAILMKRMPPWFADPRYGKFSNEHRLSEEEIQTVVSWVEGGAPAGDPADAPPPREFVQGWNIGEPDHVIEMPKEFHIPAAGTIDYHYVVLPAGFSEDRWVQAAEVRPGNREVVHHVIAFVRPPGSKWLGDAKPGEIFVPAGGETGEAAERGRRELLVGFAPGMEEGVWRRSYAKKIEKGSDIVLQLHYTANGKAATDRTKVGVTFAREKPDKRVITMAAMNRKFVIPPGAPAHEVKSNWILNETVELVSLMPHMHLRGKDFHYEAIYPNGEREVLLSVPRYDFNWQFFYYLSEPKLLPKGAEIDCTAHFDNSPNNPANPDPSEEVRWGDQSWEEMMIGWFEIAIDAGADPKPYVTRGMRTESDD